MTDIIEKIKIHEKRYTTILVIIFILLILGIFYYFLSINNKIENNKITTISHKYNEITSSYQTITLTNKKTKYKININNNTENRINYKILLLEDIKSKEKCGCSITFDNSNIKYTINGNTDSLKDNIIASGTIGKNKSINIETTMWIDTDSHYHGYLKIIKED